MQSWAPCRHVDGGGHAGALTRRRPPPQRPWREFFERFSVPKVDHATVEARIYTNVVYFKTNYLLVLVAVFLWSL